MKNYLLIIIVILLTSSVQMSAQSTFHKGFDIGYSNKAHSILKSSDGNFIVSGTGKIFGNFNKCLFLLKMNDYGDTLWTKIIGGNDFLNYSSCKKSPDGGFIIAASSVSTVGGTSDICLVKTDSTGNVLWAKTYGGLGQDVANSVEPTLDNGFIITGYTESFDSLNADIILIKTDSLGTMLWAETFDAGYDRDYGQTVIQTSDGGFMIQGMINLPIPGTCLIKTDSNGVLVWSKYYSGGGRVVNAIQTSDGGCFLTGSQVPNSWGYVLCFKTDDAGDVIWSTIYQFSVADAGHSVKEIAGGYVIAGRCNNYQHAGSPKAFLMELDLAGTIVWAKRYGSSSSAFYEGAESIEIANDDGFIFAGYRGDDACIVKTDSIGNSGCDDYGANPIIHTTAKVASPLTLITNFVNVTVNTPTFVPGGSGGVLTTYCMSTDLPEFNTLSAEPVIYPNPFTNEFIVADVNSKADLRIYDLAGREVFSQQIEPGNQKIVTQHLQSGLYFLEIVVDGHHRIKKIVKE